MKWKEGRLTLPPLDATIKKSMTLTGGTVQVKQTADRIIVTIPAGQEDKRHTVVKLKLDRPVDDVKPLEVRF